MFFFRPTEEVCRSVHSRLIARALLSSFSVLLQQTAHAPRQHFLHHGTVIRAWDTIRIPRRISVMSRAAYLEQPVLLLGRPDRKSVV